MQDLLMVADLNDLASPKLQRLQQGITQTGTASNKLGGAFDAMANKARAMGVPVDQISGLVGGMGPAMLAGVAGVGALAVGFIALTNHATSALDLLGDLATQTGVTVEYLSKMRNVVSISNLDMQKFGDGLSVITKNIIANGPAMQKMGIDTTNAGTAWDSLKIKIAATEDPIEKQRIGQEVLGKKYVEFANILNIDQEAYEKLIGSTTIFSEEAAAAAGAYDDNLTILKTSISDVAITLGAKFLPELVKITNKTLELIDAFQELTKIDIHALQNDGMQVKVNQGGRVGTQDLNSTNIKSSEAQAQLKALNSQQLLDLATWANLEKHNQDLSSNLVKLSISRKKEEDGILDAKNKQAEADRKAKDQAEQLLALAEKRQKLIEANSYSNYKSGREEQDYKETQAILNEGRYSKEYGQSVDAFGGNDTAYRDFQEDENKKKEKEFYKNKHQESLANSDNSEGEKAYAEQKNLEIYQAQEESLARQMAIYDAIGGKIEGSLIAPYSTFLLEVTRGTDGAFENIGSNMVESFGNALLQMTSMLMAKATIWAGLNILSGGGAGFATTALSKFSWMANGSDYAYGGATIVGDRGPEIINIPRGSKVTPLNKATQATTYNITINQTQGTSSEDIVREIKRFDKENGRGR